MPPLPLLPPSHHRRFDVARVYEGVGFDACQLFHSTTLTYNPILLVINRTRTLLFMSHDRGHALGRRSAEDLAKHRLLAARSVALAPFLGQSVPAGAGEASGKIIPAADGDRRRRRERPRFVVRAQWSTGMAEGDRLTLGRCPRSGEGNRSVTCRAWR